MLLLCFLSLLLWLRWQRLSKLLRLLLCLLLCLCLLNLAHHLLSLAIGAVNIGVAMDRKNSLQLVFAQGWVVAT